MLIDPIVCDFVALAQKQKHPIVPCAACGGPLVQSRVCRGLGRCLRCGHRAGGVSRCWTCGAPIDGTVPAALALEAAHGRADVAAMAEHLTCAACGGPGRAVRVGRLHSFRKCTQCKAPLGRPTSERDSDLCAACRARRTRQLHREGQRKRAHAGGSRLSAP